MARRRLRELVSSVYEKVLDESTGRFYFFNTHTGEATWEEPSVAALTDLKISPRHDETPPPPKQPIKKAADMTQGEAAIFIQRAWRAKIARRMVQRAAQAVYTKYLDEESGQEFYTNVKTGVSFWEKPAVLGDLDPLPPEELPKRPATPRFHATDLTEQDAAAHIQAAWRTKQARRKLKQLISGVYARKY